MYGVFIALFKFYAEYLEIKMKDTGGRRSSLHYRGRGYNLGLLETDSNIINARTRSDNRNGV